MQALFETRLAPVVGIDAGVIEIGVVYADLPGNIESAARSSPASAGAAARSPESHRNEMPTKMIDTNNKVARCFFNVFPDIRQDDIPRASTASLAAWDSMAHVTLLSSIAEEFGLDLELDDFEELVSYPLIVDYLGGKSTNG